MPGHRPAAAHGPTARRAGRWSVLAASVAAAALLASQPAHAQTPADAASVTVQLSRLDGWIAGTATPATAWCLTVAPDWFVDAGPPTPLRNPDQVAGKVFCLYNLPGDGSGAERLLRRDSDDFGLFLVPVDDPFAENIRHWLAGLHALSITPQGGADLETLLRRAADGTDVSGEVALEGTTRRGTPVDARLNSSPMVLTEVVVPIVVPDAFAFQRVAHIVVPAATFYQRLIQTQAAHRDVVASIRTLSDQVRSTLMGALAVRDQLGEQAAAAAGEERVSSILAAPHPIEESVAGGPPTSARGLLDELGAHVGQIADALEAIRTHAAVLEGPAVDAAPQGRAPWGWLLVFAAGGIVGGGAGVVGLLGWRRFAAGSRAAARWYALSQRLVPLARRRAAAQAAEARALAIANDHVPPESDARAEVGGPVAPSWPADGAPEPAPPDPYEAAEAGYWTAEEDGTARAVPDAAADPDDPGPGHRESTAIDIDGQTAPEPAAALPQTAGQTSGQDGPAGGAVVPEALTRDLLDSVARIIEEIGNYRLKTGEEPARMFAALAGILGEKGQAAALRYDAESYRANAESLSEEIRLTQMLLQRIDRGIDEAVRLPEAVDRYVLPEFERLRHRCDLLKQELEALRGEDRIARRV